MATGSATLPAIGTAVAGKIVDGKIIQYMQPDIGGVDASSPVTSSNPMPVIGTVAVTGAYQETQPVSGTFWQGTQPISGTVAVSNTVPVTGTFYPDTQPVSGTFWQETQPVSDGAIGTTTDEAANYGIEEDSTARTGIGLWKGIKNILQYMNDKLGGALIIAVDGDGNQVTLSGYGDGSYNGLYVYDMCELGQKFAVISAASSGNNTIVGAVADKAIRVLALTLSFSGAVNAKFQSGAGGTDKTGLYYGTTNTAIVLPYNKLGWFETAASALLNLNLSGAVAVGGCLTYIEV